MLKRSAAVTGVLMFSLAGCGHGSGGDAPTVTHSAQYVQQVHEKLTRLLTIDESRRLQIVEWGPVHGGIEEIGHLRGADEAPIRAFLAAHFSDVSVFRLTPEDVPQY